MKTKNFFLILGIIIVLVYTATILYYSFYKVVHVEQSPYSFNVHSVVGLVGDTDAVKFGGVLQGGLGERYVSFRNQFDFPVNLKITISGDHSDWIYVEDNNFLLVSQGTREITFTVVVPKSAEFGNYSGVITVEYLRD